MMMWDDFYEFIEEAPTIFLEDIREGNPCAFTRKRKTTPLKLMLQMFSQKGMSQFSELQLLLCTKQTIRRFNCRLL